MKTFIWYLEGGNTITAQAENLQKAFASLTMRQRAEITVFGIRVEEKE